MTKPLTEGERAELERFRNRDRFTRHRHSPRRNRLIFGATEDYGYVVWRDFMTGLVHLCEYDDDDFDAALEINMAILYSSANMCRSECYDTIAPLDKFNPEWITTELAEEYVYAIMLMPDVTFCRVKLGRSTRVNDRLKSYRTICPTSLLVGLWPGGEAAEAFAHAKMGGYRIGTSEVFHLYHPWDDLAHLHDHMTKTPK